ncbi:MAG TPA: prolipoprotein diacylglyceryl transferase family protein [bacterium]|nr:prolipoprotein diacylglyceryl transferase family protein [bacterium]
MYPVFLRDIPNPLTGETFDIRWYGVWFMVALLVGLFVFARRGRRMLGLPFDDVLILSVIVIAAGLFGAKLLTVFLRLDYFWADPLGFLFGRSNISITGGLLGGGLALWLCTRRKEGIGFLGVADALAGALPLAQALGRQGCFSAGCCYGKPTHAWWGVTFTHPDSVCGLKDVPLIPTQLLESGLNLLLFIGIILFEKFCKKRRQGATFLVYGFGYGTIRFVMDFLRADKQAFWLGLTTNQWAVVVGFVLLGLAWWRLLPKSALAVEAYADPPARRIFKTRIKKRDRG